VISNCFLYAFVATESSSLIYLFNRVYPFLLEYFVASYRIIISSIVLSFIHDMWLNMMFEVVDNFSGRNRVLGVAGPEDDALEAALGLGELADLTVNNDVDPLNYDVSISFLSAVFIE